MPDTGVLRAKVLVRVACMAQDLLYPEAKTIVEFRIRGSLPNPLSGVFSPSSVSGRYTAQECSDTTYRKTFESQLIVVANRNARAFEELDVPVRAWVNKTSVLGTHASLSIKGNLTVRADYLPLTPVAPDTLFQKLPTETKGSFVVQVGNLANGDTRVQIDWTQINGTRMDWLHAGPEIRLGSRLGGNNPGPSTHQRLIEFKTGMSSGLATLRATFRSAYDGVVPEGSENLKDETSFVATVQVMSGLAEMPAAPAAWTLAALAAGIGLAVRRRG